MSDPQPGETKLSLSQRFQSLASEARTFVEDRVWDWDLGALSRAKRALVTLCRICVIVVRGFVADNCSLQASALTYITLMSMVPVLALMLSVSKGLGMQDRLMQTAGLERTKETQEFVVIPGSWLSEMPAEMKRVAQTLVVYVENTNFATLGTIGLLLLVWTVLQTMGQIERSFNLIWGVKAPRTLLRRFSDYFSVLIVVPFCILAATSANTALSSEKALALLARYSGPFFLLYECVIGLAGVAGILAAFFMLYLFMPNTKVRVGPAIVAGVVGGILWYISQRVYIEGQMGLTRLNAIYGTFAAIPFFLLWLYVSWLLVLFGAEVGFAVQHHHTYILESGASKASMAARELLGLAVTYEICRTFHDGRPHWSARDYGMAHRVPARLLADVTHVLAHHGIIVAVAGHEFCFVPAKDIHVLNIAEVEEAFRGTRDAYLRRLPTAAGTPAATAFLKCYEGFTRDLAGLTFGKLLESGRAESVRH